MFATLLAPAHAEVPSLVSSATQQVQAADGELTIDVDRVMVELPAPPGAGREWRAAGAMPQLAGGTRTMLWSRSGAWQLGMGVEQASATSGSAHLAPVTAQRVLLGAAVDTSANTQLTWRAPVAASTLAREAQQPRTMEVSLVLKPQDALANLRRGSLMKMELSGQTQLSLRPRGGGRITLQLTSKW